MERILAEDEFAIFSESAEMPRLRQGSRVYGKRCEGFRRRSAKKTAQAGGEFVQLASTKN